MTDETGLSPVCEGIWVDAAPVRMFGIKFSSTMTVVRLSEGSLLLYSPIELTPERRAAVESLGCVEHLYAPNLYHHLWIEQWAAAFPNARVHVPRGLRKKRPSLRVDRVHGSAPEPAFTGVVDEIRIAGCRLEETALHVRPAGTLIVADLVHNVGRTEHTWSKLYMQTMGFYDRVALSRVLRWTAFSDRAAARRSVDELLALPFERLIMCHGAPLTNAAREELATAYGWLA